jgi:hypothetical protein
MPMPRQRRKKWGEGMAMRGDWIVSIALIRGCEAA